MKYVNSLLKRIYDIYKHICNKLNTNVLPFILREKKARIGRNPKTKISSIINQRKVISFKASKEFKNYINTDE